MSTHRQSVRREIRSVERGLDEFQREVGDLIVWYSIDHENSTSSDTYGEGPVPDPFDAAVNPVGTTPTGLRFRPPQPIPVVWIRYIPPTGVQTEAGEYTLATTTMRLSTKVARRSGLLHPLEPQFHYDDRYFYNGVLYRVEQYLPKGWMHNAYLMIDVTGRELKQEELFTDSFPFYETDAPAGTAGDAVAWTPGQRLNWAPTQPNELDP